MTNEEKLICDLTWISTSSHLSHSSVNQDSSVSIPVSIWCNDGYDSRADHSPLNSIGSLMNLRVTFLSSIWMLCCVSPVGCMHTFIVVSIYCRVTGDNWGCCSFHNGLLSVLISYQGGFIHYHIYPPWPVADNDTGTEDTELFHKLKLLPPPWSGFQYPPALAQTMLSSRNGGATFLLPGDLLSSMQTRTITKVPAFAAKNTSGDCLIDSGCVNRAHSLCGGRAVIR